eukprot:scpid60765/ scgid25947/ 
MVFGRAAAWRQHYFNIYMWAVFQLWYRAIENVPDIGLPVATNTGGKLLFRRKATDVIKKHNDCQFADDSALIATSHTGAQQVLTIFMDIAAVFGLKVNLAKTKVMPAGYGITPADRLPLLVAGNTVESVEEFRYLGSLVHTTGRSFQDIKSHIAGASRAFGVHRRSVFMDANLSIATKRVVYEACVLSLLLLYCSECWVPLQQDITALSTFHFRCIRSILEITRQAVWSDRITNTQVLAIWNDTKQDDIPTRLLRRRMEWLGHVARIDDDRTPRQLLFGSLLPTRPACGPRKRWRDAVLTDIRHLHLEGDWFDTAQQRGEWRTAFR